MTKEKKRDSSRQRMSRSLKVLALNFEVDAEDLLRERLEDDWRADVRIHCVCDHDLAISFARTAWPDLVLVQVREIQGSLPQLLEILEALPTLPIVVIARHSDAFAALAIEAGIQDVLRLAEVSAPGLLARSILFSLARHALLLEIEQYAEELQRVNARLAVQAQHDPLTDCLNRLGLKNRLGALVEEASSQHDLSVLTIDLDRFKEVNDEFGHAVGDEVLKRAAACMKSGLRSTDFIARIGGDEFVVVLVNSAPSLAEQVAERLRRSVENMLVITSSGQAVGISASIGAATVPVDQDAIDRVFQLADEALYRSKKDGRNRVSTTTVTKTDLAKMRDAAESAKQLKRFQ